MWPPGNWEKALRQRIASICSHLSTQTRTVQCCEMVQDSDRICYSLQTFLNELRHMYLHRDMLASQCKTGAGVEATTEDCAQLGSRAWSLWKQGPAQGNCDEEATLKMQSKVLGQGVGGGGRGHSGGPETWLFYVWRSKSEKAQRNGGRCQTGTIHLLALPKTSLGWKKMVKLINELLWAGSTLNHISWTHDLMRSH